MVLSTFNKELYERDLKKEGEFRYLIKMVVRKLKKNKPPEVIAEELEEELSVVSAICDTAKECAGEYDIDDIFGKLWE